MPEPPSPRSLDAPDGHPLIGVPLEKNGHEVVRYFADETAADEALVEKHGQGARQLAGAWKRADPTLDWDDLADELDRIRHGSKPTPPIDLDL